MCAHVSQGSQVRHAYYKDLLCHGYYNTKTDFIEVFRLQKQALIEQTSC